MTRLIACLIAAALLLPLAGGKAADAPPARTPAALRVLTYNIHHGAGADGVLDLERIARVIRSAEPDLVALQEVDVNTRRSGGVDQAAKLGELTGMHASFAKAMDYDGGQYGCAILSRRRPVEARRHPLPADEGREPRVLAEVRVTAGDEPGAPPVVFLGTHLDHASEAQRLSQVREIERVTSRIDGPAVILAGDLNARPGSEVMTELLRHWTDATADPELKTFPAAAPRSKIDYVLYRPGPRLKPVESRVLEEKVASDHRPVLTVFQILPE